jgi:hypothetical protein
MSTLRGATELFVVCLILSLSPIVFATTVIHVPADQPTIQTGINAASNGDTVLVSPGTYYENINFNGKAITVASVGGPGVTILSSIASAYSPTVTFSSNETAATILSGFTIQGGYSAQVQVTSGSPTIQDNIIQGAPGLYATGIYISSGSAPVVRGNLIINNLQGGIGSFWDNGSQILGNIIANNPGSGIVVNYNNANVVVQQNTILDNGGNGINYSAPGSPLTLVQNLITGNSYPGVQLGGPADEVTLVGNTIVGNQFGCCGDGASEVEFFQISSAATVQNNLIVATGSAPALWCGTYLGDPVLTNNDVFAAKDTAYSGSCQDSTGINGNISADPLFTGLLSDNFHIQSGSPSINAGTNSAPGQPSQDIDGDPRVAGGTVDMGVDEYSKKATVTVSQSALHFPAQNVGTSSPPQVVTLTNKGTTAFTVGTIATGPNFSQNNNCGDSLAAGASCRINVVFSPTIGDTVNGVLGIFTGATLNPQVVRLVGTGLAPQVQFYANFYFYGQVIGTSATQTATLTNVGQAPLLISSIALSAPADFTQTNTCPIAPASLAVGASCNVSVTFSPTIISSENGSLTITDNASPNTQTAYVNGSSVSAGIPTLNPTNLTFPVVLIGQSSVPQTATLTNTGTGALGIRNIYSYGDFPQTNDCPAFLAVGASCTLTIIFTPTNQGNENGYIWIYTDSAYYQVTLSNSGTGQAPVPTLSSLSLSSIAAGSSDTAMTVTGAGFVYNSRVLWNGAVLPYSYEYGNTQINFTIPAANLANAGTNQITVFTPQPGGGTSNAVPFTVYTPINYGVQAIPYKYQAIAGTNLKIPYFGAANLATPFPIQFGGGSYTNMTVGAGGMISFENYASEYNSPIPTTQTRTLIAPFWAFLYPWGSGNNNNVFWAVTGTAPNRQLIVEWRNLRYCCGFLGTVKFEVVFFEGSSNIQFNYADTVFGGSGSSNDNGATASVGIQVTPTLGTQFSYYTPSLASKTSLLWYPSAPTATVSTNALGFGYHKIGSASHPQKFTLTNGGLVTLNITDVSISSADFSQTNDCGSPVDPGKSCTFLVTFNPSQPVAETATLSITDNAVNTPQTVSLSGIGAIQPIVIFPIQLNFGGVTVGQSSTLPVTLANAANTKLTIQQITTTSAAFVATNNCGASLAPGASCTVNVTFTPTQPGNVSGKLLMGLNGKAVVPEAKLVGNGQ